MPIEPASDVDRQGAELVLRMAAGLSLSFVDPHAAALLVPAAEAAVAGLVGRVWHRQTERATVVVVRAAEEAGEAPEILMARAEDDERREELALRVLRTAASSASSEKMRALSRALTSGLLAEDDAILDAELLFVAALEAIDIPHIRVLELLERAPSISRHPIADPPFGYTNMHLSNLSPGLGAGMAALTGVLASHGLIEDITELGLGSHNMVGKPAAWWRLSKHGERMLNRMREIDASAGRPAVT